MHVTLSCPIECREISFSLTECHVTPPTFLITKQILEDLRLCPVSTKVHHVDVLENWSMVPSFIASYFLQGSLYKWQSVVFIFRA